MWWVIHLIILVVSILMGLFGFGLAAIAGSDPEGRSGSGLIVFGLVLSLIGATGFFYSLGSVVWRIFTK